MLLVCKQNIPDRGGKNRLFVKKKNSKMALSNFITDVLLNIKNGSDKYLKKKFLKEFVNPWSIQNDVCRKYDM